MLVKYVGRFTPSLVFRRSTAVFYASACLELCDFSLYPHGSESILLGFGAVMMLGGRQSGETFRSALPEPILNVDMLTCLPTGRSLHSNFCPV